MRLVVVAALLVVCPMDVGRWAMAQKAQPPPKRGAPVVAWVGFESEGGSARVFLQMSRAPSLEQRVVGDELVVALGEAQLDTTNDGRPLDTRFFPTDVVRVDLRPVRTKRKRSLELRIQFKDAKAARTAETRTAEKGGWTIVYLDLGPPKSS